MDFVMPFHGQQTGMPSTISPWNDQTVIGDYPRRFNWLSRLNSSPSAKWTTAAVLVSKVRVLQEGWRRYRRVDYLRVAVRYPIRIFRDYRKAMDRPTVRPPVEIHVKLVACLTNQFSATLQSLSFLVRFLRAQRIPALS